MHLKPEARGQPEQPEDPQLSFTEALAAIVCAAQQATLVVLGAAKAIAQLVPQGVGGRLDGDAVPGEVPVQVAPMATTACGPRY